MKKLLLTLAAITLTVFAASAQQTTDDEDLQSWNDVQLSLPLSGKVDLYTAVTLRFGKNVSRLNDGRFAFGVTWKPFKDVAITPFYWNIEARNARGQFRCEHRLNLRGTYRFPFKRFGLTHRSTYEYRMRSSGNTWRYRAALNFEKEVPAQILPKAKFLIGNEVFYDSATGRFSRNRFSIGINKTIHPKLSVDINYMRQNDGFSHPGDLNVLWIAWRIKL